MLFLSIIFILTGIAILIYSIINESRNRDLNLREYPEKVSAGMLKVRDLEKEHHATRNRSEIYSGTIPVYKINEKGMNKAERQIQREEKAEGREEVGFDTLKEKAEKKELKDEIDDFINDDLIVKDLDQKTEELNLDDVEEKFDDFFSDDPVNKKADELKEKPPDSAKNGMAGDLEITPLSQTASLYEDNSTIIDYHRGKARIDPELKEYGKIKRIGSGQLIFENDGISFYCGKKFYRYDFHRLTDLKSGNNFIALMVKASSAVKLLIIENPPFIQAIDENFRKFKGIA